MGEQSAAEMMWAKGRELAIDAARRNGTLRGLLQDALCDYGEQHLLHGWDSTIKVYDGDDCKEPARWIAMYLAEAAKVEPNVTAPFAAWL